MINCFSFTHQDKTRKLLSSKAELVAAKQSAIMANKAVEELQFNCNNLDDVRQTLYPLQS